MFIPDHVASELMVRYAVNKEEQVQVRRLDDIVSTRVDLVKVDVESMELPMLRGARNTLMKHRPVLFVEDSEAEDMANMKEGQKNESHAVYGDAEICLCKPR